MTLSSTGSTLKRGEGGSPNRLAVDSQDEPENLLVEVYDFILFLETKKEKALLTKASQQLSEASFEKIWIKEEDAVYDTL